MILDLLKGVELRNQKAPHVGADLCCCIQLANFTSYGATEVIQAEVLSRLRHSQGEVPPELRDAMIISIQGIAAGMQNTG